MYTWKGLNASVNLSKAIMVACTTHVHNFIIIQYAMYSSIMSPCSITQMTILICVGVFSYVCAG